MLRALLAELAVRDREALMIGDTTHDMEMARAAGVARLAVAYGAHPRDALLSYEPLTCVDDLTELGDWLMQHA